MDLQDIEVSTNAHKVRKLISLIEELPKNTIEAQYLDIRAQFNEDSVELIQTYQSAKERLMIKFNIPSDATNAARTIADDKDKNNICEFIYKGEKYMLRESFQIAF